MRKSILLNFGAVDYHAIVFVNGKQAAEDMYAQEHQVNYHGIDKKQRREIRAKKQAQGHTMSW